MEKFGDRLRHAWDVFTGRDPTLGLGFPRQPNESYNRPDRRRLNIANERSLLNSIITRIAIDVASVSIRHVRIDENGNFLDYIKSKMDYCFTRSANIDQTGRALLIDIALSLLDEGAIAVIPTSGTLAPYDIDSIRVGKITAWYPDKIKAKLYNENTGKQVEQLFKKKQVAILENPFYQVMNQPNSTLKRLVNKLNLLDQIDSRMGANKLDILIQFPFSTAGGRKQSLAETRRKELESQLVGSKFGIGYLDANEKVIPLNRAVENDLLKQIQEHKSTLFSELGITMEILNGSANLDTMTNYYTRTVEPILDCIVDGMSKAFITKTAHTQGQSIMYFRDPFKLVNLKDFAQIAQILSVNTIASANELRSVIGFKPSEDPNADMLYNKNINQYDPNAGIPPEDQQEEVPQEQIYE